MRIATPTVTRTWKNISARSSASFRTKDTRERMKNGPPKNGLNGASVGLIGAGLMGLAMAERLCAGGHEVLGWDISSVQRSALSNLGGAVAGNSNEVFTRCNHVILSLPDDDVVSRVLNEAGPALH